MIIRLCVNNISNNCTNGGKLCKKICIFMEFIVYVEQQG